MNVDLPEVPWSIQQYHPAKAVFFAMKNPLKHLLKFTAQPLVGRD